MRFPEHPLTINGGCNCGSIRYKVNVPAFEDRPALPYCDENARDDTERIPTVFIDHCNDCRRASGALLPVWLICAISVVEFSINSTWTPAAELLKKEDLEIQKPPPFKLYRSSEPSFRGFCENCGTMLCYRSRKGFPDGWPDMVDILVGTVDREDLEKEWMKPQRELSWDMGIPWIQDLARDGTVKVDTPRHPLWKVNIHVPSS
jgi:hypothetical protein